jgi:hypothetical protein
MADKKGGRPLNYKFLAVGRPPVTGGLCTIFPDIRTFK